MEKAPLSPSASKRNAKVSLTQAEVDEILLLIPQGTSVAAVLRKLGMYRTTFDRVLSRDYGIIIETHVVARELEVFLRSSRALPSA